jgi:hypothetical protein
MVSENRVQKKTFTTKREEVTGGLRRLHNELLHNLYSSSFIIKIMNSGRTKLAA